ncbi:hypothetical protein COW09_01985 [bacterium (Candidatus Moisslbacteria) CG12_big_fil_rev_8_21_14_0_65_36_11]|nr:hypothetical protein [Candidatus Kuenenbacteria bacterium]OIP76601.1 MAG: hypothetical protein AUK09_01455 [Parcubacteria group bacterium CG2_30_36_38]PIV46112.1 MAG: hypothetical protein COS23_00745 [bacterium (Candidatus Moisslbacteria) CG02_land_8_20_14_3_00_36_53]PIW67671.1 MAG: hypothetical protein COW09_01985 [bacterium (Candidatus Moisslbacteria) CG12_big_fil_rev_8_21_14_0_65_36_11]PIZ90352.1 MAG: hypothetical protein COX87_01080 [bacterium (Candidatus Moisslbacteria) CG_4_10_14_0_2_u
MRKLDFLSKKSIIKTSMKNILIFIFILCFITFSLPVLAQETTTGTTTEIKEGSDLSLFWQDFKDTLKIFFTWNNVEKAKVALNIAERKLDEYKKYRAEQKDKLAGESLKKYEKEIEIVLDVLGKESNKPQAEQIALEVKERTTKSILELQELYEQSPEPLKEKIVQIISKLQKSYEVSLGIMSGEYREEAQGLFGQFKNWFKNSLEKIYYKLWPTFK